MQWKRRNKQHLPKPPEALRFLQLKSIFWFLNDLIRKLDFLIVTQFFQSNRTDFKFARGSLKEQIKPLGKLRKKNCNMQIPAIWSPTIYVQRFLKPGDILTNLTAINSTIILWPPLKNPQKKQKNGQLNPNRIEGYSVSVNQLPMDHLINLVSKSLSKGKRPSLKESLSSQNLLASCL